MARPHPFRRAPWALALLALGLGVSAPGSSRAQPPSSAPSSQPPAPVVAPTPANPPGEGEAPEAGEADSDWVERLMFNSNERTRRGSASLEARDYGTASAAMDSALRLAPEDARARFNAGTAKLPVQPDEAKGLLEGLVGSTTDASLASKAAYNLGNLHLEGNELPQAIDAYKEALRRAPDFEDAKHNLELAQRRLREQQQNQDQQEQNQDQQDQEQQNQDQQDQDQQEQDQQDQDQQEQNQDQQEQNQDQQEQNEQEQNQDQQQQDQDQDQQEQQNQEQQQGEQESPLPQFQDLEDMSAEEAAAILEAIENMEREQRRQEALEAAKAQVGRKKDW